MTSRVYRQWEDGFVVRRMTRQDAEKVISWYSGVCATSVDLQVALDVRGDDSDVDGFYVGELNGEMVASKLEIAVADGLGYGSMFYVDERYRGSGLGRRINDVARDVTERTSLNTVGIDAHAELESMDVRRGYHTAFAITQFTGRVQPDDTGGKTESAVRQVTYASGRGYNCDSTSIRLRLDHRLTPIRQYSTVGQFYPCVRAAALRPKYTRKVVNRSS